MDFTAPQDGADQRHHDGVLRGGRGHPGRCSCTASPSTPSPGATRSPAVVDAGFRAIVPSQRGYGGTDAPADAQTYSVKNLVADLTGLLDALGIEQGGLLRPRLGLDAGLVLGDLRPRAHARHRQPLHSLLHLGIAAKT